MASSYPRNGEASNSASTSSPHHHHHHHNHFYSNSHHGPALRTQRLGPVDDGIRKRGMYKRFNWQSRMNGLVEPIAGRSIASIKIKGRAAERAAAAAYASSRLNLYRSTMGMQEGFDEEAILDDDARITRIAGADSLDVTAHASVPSLFASHVTGIDQNTGPSTTTAATMQSPLKTTAKRDALSTTASLKDMYPPIFPSNVSPLSASSATAAVAVGAVPSTSSARLPVAPSSSSLLPSSSSSLPSNTLPLERPQIAMVATAAGTGKEEEIGSTSSSFFSSSVRHSTCVGEPNSHSQSRSHSLSSLLHLNFTSSASIQQSTASSSSQQVSVRQRPASLLIDPFEDSDESNHGGGRMDLMSPVLHPDNAFGNGGNSGRPFPAIPMAALPSSAPRSTSTRDDVRQEANNLMHPSSSTEAPLVDIGLSSSSRTPASHTAHSYSPANYGNVDSLSSSTLRSHMDSTLGQLEPTSLVMRSGACVSSPPTTEAKGKGRSTSEKSQSTTVRGGDRSMAPAASIAPTEGSTRPSHRHQQLAAPASTSSAFSSAKTKPSPLSVENLQTLDDHIDYIDTLLASMNGGTSSATSLASNLPRNLHGNILVPAEEARTSQGLPRQTISTVVHAQEPPLVSSETLSRTASTYANIAPAAESASDSPVDSRSMPLSLSRRQRKNHHRHSRQRDRRRRTYESDYDSGTEPASSASSYERGPGSVTSSGNDVLEWQANDFYFPEEQEAHEAVLGNGGSTNGSPGSSAVGGSNVDLTGAQPLTVANVERAAMAARAAQSKRPVRLNGALPFDHDDDVEQHQGTDRKDPSNEAPLFSPSRFTLEPNLPVPPARIIGVGLSTGARAPANDYGRLSTSTSFTAAATASVPLRQPVPTRNNAGSDGSQTTASRLETRLVRAEGGSIVSQQYAHLPSAFARNHVDESPIECETPPIDVSSRAPVPPPTSTTNNSKVKFAEEVDETKFGRQGHAQEELLIGEEEDNSLEQEPHRQLHEAAIMETLPKPLLPVPVPAPASKPQTALPNGLNSSSVDLPSKATQATSIPKEPKFAFEETDILKGYSMPSLSRRDSDTSSPDSSSSDFEAGSPANQRSKQAAKAPKVRHVGKEPELFTQPDDESPTATNRVKSNTTALSSPSEDSDDQDGKARRSKGGTASLKCPIRWGGSLNRKEGGGGGGSGRHRTMPTYGMQSGFTGSKHSYRAFSPLGATPSMNEANGDANQHGNSVYRGEPYPSQPHQQQQFDDGDANQLSFADEARGSGYYQLSLMDSLI